MGRFSLFEHLLTFLRELGFHAGLLSLAAFRDCALREIRDHFREIASVMPVFGFYLQPAVGGVVPPAPRSGA